MNEQQIRQIVQQEMRKYNSTARFSQNPLQRHLHNGLDSPQINNDNVIKNIPVSGSITMSQETTYTIGLANTPSTATQVFFNGIVVHNGGGGIDIRAHCIGTANFAPSFYLQPGTSTTVNAGGTQQEIIQSSSMLLIDQTGPTFRALVDEGHIVDVEYSGVKARATVVSYSKNSIVVDVETLASGYSIVGNWVIT